MSYGRNNDYHSVLDTAIRSLAIKAIGLILFRSRHAGIAQWNICIYSHRRESLSVFPRNRHKTSIFTNIHELISYTLYTYHNNNPGVQDIVRILDRSIKNRKYMHCLLARFLLLLYPSPITFVLQPFFPYRTIRLPCVQLRLSISKVRICKRIPIVPLRWTIRSACWVLSCEPAYITPPQERSGSHLSPVEIEQLRETGR